ncbi:MAG TPA: ABC transporter substrate-binding protein [Aliidongia sp.]|nr:ABC transporter substrate-binding protein [Aliidongia sp.]
MRQHRDANPDTVTLPRRAMLRAAVAAGLGTFGAGIGRVFASPGLHLPAEIASTPICHVAETVLARPNTKLTLSWSANAICTVGILVAQQRGIFERHNLDVELVSFAGSTDQLLEAISSGKADAGVGMALRWLKPLEQGFDVKITTGVHSGCMRLLATPGSEIRGVADLKGRTVGVSDMAAPDKNFFSIVAAKQGIDPASDVAWKAFPADLLSLALKKGEIDAVSLIDPLATVIRDRDGLTEIANNISGDYAQRVCCVLGIGGKLVRNDRAAAGALTQSLREAGEYVATNPDDAATLFAPYSPAPVAQLAQMLRSHNHHHHPVGTDLRAELAAYTDDLKLVQVIRAGLDSQRFADKIYADVLTS